MNIFLKWAHQCRIIRLEVLVLCGVPSSPQTGDGALHDSEQGSAFREEASSEDDSQEISSAPDETETIKGSFDERATTVGEGQYEYTSQPTTSPVCSSPLSFSCIFLFPCLIFSIFPSFTEINFSNRGEDGFIFGLVFLGPDHFSPLVLSASS